VSAPTPPFVVDQAVRPTKEMLDHYPIWASTHDRPCKIAHINPSFNHKAVFQGWDIAINFSDETCKYLVSQQHLEPA
jgi:hypothetical protein